MPDTGTTVYPADDALNLPTDKTISPTSAGDGTYTFIQLLQRIVGFIRAIYADFVGSHKPNVNAHHNRDHDLAGSTHTAASTDLSLNSHKITSLATPTGANDAANKAYVDAVAQGLSPKPSVKGASTANHSISAFSGTTIDGGSVSLSNGDRILLKDQSTPSENGLWVFNGAGSALTRPTDFAHGAQEAGAFVFVESGTANVGAGYVLASTAVTVDTTAQTWTQFSGAGEITAGTGLTKTGNTLNVVANADGTIVANADDVQVGTLVAGNVPTGLITSAMVANGTLIDADVNASAAIASSKLADGGLITGAVQKSVVTTKGDLLVASGSAAVDRLAVGTDGYSLVSDSTATDGVTWKPRSRITDEAHADVVVGPSSVVETTIATLAVPTSVQSGDLLVARLFGEMTNNSGSSQAAHSVKIKLGATTVNTGNPLGSVSTSASPRAWTMDVFLVVATPASAQRLRGWFFLGTPNISGTWGASAAEGSVYGTAAEDLTAGKNLVVTVTLGASDANLSLTLHGASLEVVKKA